MQPKEKTRLTPEAIVSRHSRTAVLILVFYLALFVLVGSLLMSNNTGIIQWNGLTRAMLVFMITSGISWIVHTLAVFKVALEPPNPRYNRIVALREIFGGLYIICFPVAIVLLIVAIWV